MITVPGLDALLPRRGAPPATGLIVGPGGMGKTTALAELVERHEAAGVAVHRVTGRRAEMDDPFAALDRLVAVTDGDTVSTVRHALLDRLGQGPWLVAVDDVDLVHESTVTAIAGVADRAERRGGVIVTHRPDAGGPPVAALDEVLAALGARVVVGPWPEDAISEHVRAALPLASADTARAIWATTGGNPALVVAAVDDLETGGRAVIEWVRAELAKMSAPARAVALAMAAGVPTPALAAVCDLADEDVSVAAAELGRAGLLAADRRAVVECARAALLDLTPPVELQRVHARAADVLTAAAAPPTEVAPHQAAAARTGPHTAAVLLRAASDVATTDPAQALAWIDAAQAAGATRSDVAELGAMAAFRAGNTARARLLADEALADDSRSHHVAAEVAAAVTRAAGQARLAISRWDAVANGKDGRASARAAAAARAATLAAMTGAVDDADDYMTLAAKLAPKTPTVDLTGEMTLAGGVIAAVKGDVDRGLDDAAHAMTLLDAPPLGAEAAAAIATVLAVAAGHEQRAARLGETVRGPTSVGLIACLRLRAGEIATAEAMTAALAETDLAPRDAVLAGAVRVGVARRGTDLPRLAAAWDHAAPLAESVDLELPMLPLLGELVAGAVRVGPKEGDALARRWAQLVAAAGAAPVWRAHLHWWQVQWAAAAGDAVAAANAAEALSAVVDAAPGFEAHARAGEAWAAVLAGSFDAGGIAEAADGLATAGMGWEASVLAGAAALRTTESGAARVLLGKGRDLRSRLATTDTAAATDDALSDREQEVAALVVEGLTHREIGAQLFISPKTVEHHVARIRQKLGATTRAEMLAAIRETLAHS